MDTSARPFTWSKTYRKLSPTTTVWCRLCRNKCVKHSMKRHLKTFHKVQHDAEVEGMFLISKNKNFELISAELFSSGGYD